MSEVPDRKELLDVSRHNRAAWGWIKVFRNNALVVEDLIEIRPPRDAQTSCGGRPLEWSRKWPAEMIWRLRKEETEVVSGRS
jgi:hypothetical protein